MPDRISILDAMYQALNEDIGVVIRVEDPARARSAFYVARGKDIQLQVLGLFATPLDHKELYILKREVYDAQRRTREENSQPPQG